MPDGGEPSGIFVYPAGHTIECLGVYLGNKHI